jgi:ribosomal protein S27E
MKFSFTCGGCGHSNDADWSHVGQQIACGGCGHTLTIPPPREAVPAEVEPVPVLRFACPACGRKYSTKSELAGQKIRCSRCGAGVRVPGGDSGAPATHSTPSLKSRASENRGSGPPRPPRAEVTPSDVYSLEADNSGNGSMLEQLASIQGVSRPDRPGTVLSSRAQMMEQVREQTIADEAVEAEQRAEKARKKKRKKRKKTSGYFDPKDTLILVGGVGALVGVLALVAWRFPDLRFPLGGFLCVTGFIVYLLGAVALRQLVAEEGAFKMLAYRFFPPYQWWFVLSRWADTRDYFAFFASGLLIMAIGGAVIKTSPVGARAEESERAYQRARGGGQAEASTGSVDGPVGDEG